MSATRGAGALLWAGATAVGALSVVIAATGGRLESLHAVSCQKSAMVVSRVMVRIVLEDKGFLTITYFIY